LSILLYLLAPLCSLLRSKEQPQRNDFKRFEPGSNVLEGPAFPLDAIADMPVDAAMREKTWRKVARHPSWNLRDCPRLGSRLFVSSVGPRRPLDRKGDRFRRAGGDPCGSRNVLFISPQGHDPEVSEPPVA
jgi:hypothetical protein